MPLGVGSVNSLCMGSSVHCQALTDTVYGMGEGIYGYADVAIYLHSCCNLHCESFSLWQLKRLLAESAAHLWYS